MADMIIFDRIQSMTKFLIVDEFPSVKKKKF